MAETDIKKVTSRKSKKILRPNTLLDLKKVCPKAVDDLIRVSSPKSMTSTPKAQTIVSPKIPSNKKPEQTKKLKRPKSAASLGIKKRPMSAFSRSTASATTLSYRNRPVSAKYHIVQHDPTKMGVEVTYDPHFEN